MWIHAKTDGKRELTGSGSERWRGKGDGGLVAALGAITDEGMQQLQASCMHAFDTIAGQRQGCVVVQVRLQCRLQFGDAFDAKICLQGEMIHGQWPQTRYSTGLTAGSDAT